MKPLRRKNYGSIPHLSNSKLGPGDFHINAGQESILTVKKRDKHDTIIVTEKYDGTNVGVAKVGGKLYALTRSGYEAHTSPYRQHHLFDQWFKDNIELFGFLSDGERVVGEWLAQAHGMVYTIKQKHPIVFFDYFTNQNTRYLFQDFQDVANLPLPRTLHIGDAIRVGELIPFLNLKTDTILPKDNPEGMVYKVERFGEVDFLAKWVRPDFEAGKYCIGIDEDKLIWNEIHSFK